MSGLVEENSRSGRKGRGEGGRGTVTARVPNKRRMDVGGCMRVGF